MTHRHAPLAAAVLALIAGSALAQTQGQPPSPAVEAQLAVKGEQYHRAPDSAQNPVELSATQRLNAEVAAQGDLAAQQNRAAAVEARVDRAEYRKAVADSRAEAERQQVDASINAQSRAEFNAEQQARYEKAMADWRATVRACESGDTARCRAGQQQPVRSDY